MWKWFATSADPVPNGTVGEEGIEAVSANPSSSIGGRTLFRGGNAGLGDRGGLPPNKKKKKV